MKNHYHVLGLSRDATPEQIKTAYRKLSLKFHPDKNEGEDYFSEMFRQVNEAYNILCDATLRKQYDAKLYKFENPEPIVKTVYQQPKPSQPKPTTYNNYQPKVDKWQPVKTWGKIRNVMLLVNAILILIIFLKSKSVSNNVFTNSKDTVTHTAKAYYKPRKTKRIKKVNVQSQLQVDTNLSSKEPEAVKEKKKEIINSPDTLSVESALSIDTIKVHEEPKKRKGFFKRLFGKKSKDSI
jgi:curved DNA-binding protein CbpA